MDAHLRAFAVAFAVLCGVVVVVCGSSSPAAAHGDIPESDVACTGRLLLNDDLTPDAAGGRHRVAARAEILASDGAPLGTFYVDDRARRYVALDPEVDPALRARLGLPAVAPAGGEPTPLAADVDLPARLHLASCH